LRVGGAYRLGMQTPAKPAPSICVGEFREVDPPRRLVYTWAWERGDSKPEPTMEGETLVTVEFVAVGPATEVVLTHERFPSADAAAQHTHGWNACLDVLGGVIESMCPRHVNTRCDRGLRRRACRPHPGGASPPQGRHRAEDVRRDRVPPEGEPAHRRLEDLIDRPSRRRR